MLNIARTSLADCRVADMQVLCGLPPGVLGRPRSASTEDASREHLERFGHYVAGRIDWATSVVTYLDDGELFEGLGAACDCPRELGLELSARLDAAWSAHVKAFERQVAELVATLEAVPTEAAVAAASAVDLKDKVQKLLVTATRPTTKALVGAAKSVDKELRSACELASLLPAYAELERSDVFKQLFELGQHAWARLSQLALSPTGSSPESTALFRALPQLLLAREMDVLRRIVDCDDLHEVRLADSWLHEPVANRRHRAGIRHARVFEAVTHQLSPWSRALVDDIAPSPTSTRSWSDCRAIVERSQQYPRARERGKSLVGAAKSAPEETQFRDYLLAAGLAEFANAELCDGRGLHGKSLLIDALSLLANHHDPEFEWLTGSVVDCLAIAWAWPALQEDGTPLNEWLRSPERFYDSAIRRARIEPLCRAWATDLESDAAAELFLMRISACLGDDVTLFRQCARALLRTSALQRKPELSVRRLEMLLRPANPPDKLIAALGNVGREIAALGEGSTMSRGTLASLGTGVSAQLEALNENNISAAPVDELLERLPKLLTDLAHSAQTLMEPSLSVRTLIPEYYATDRDVHVSFPAAITNAPHAATAHNVSAFLRLAKQQGYPVPLLAQLDIGEVQPGEEKELRFEVSVPKFTSDHDTEWRYRIELEVSGQRVTHNLRTSVRPESRSYKNDPFQAGAALRSGELFVGRTRELQELRSALLGDSRKRAILIHGIRRIGKTSLLHRLLEEPEIKRRYRVCFWDVEDRPRTDTTAHFLRDLAFKIRECIPKSRWDAISLRRDEFLTDPLECFASFVQSVDALPGAPQVLLGIDEFDHVVQLATSDSHPEFDPEVLGAIRKALMSSTFLHIVFCGLSSLLEVDYNSRLFGLMHSIPVRAIKESEADEIINAAQHVWTPTQAARRLLHRLSGRQPYLLQKMCSGLFHRLQNAGRETVACFDVADMVEDRMSDREAIRDYEKLIPEPDWEIYRALARAHQAAPKRDFVSVGEVVHALGAAGIDLTRTDVHRRLSAASAPAEADGASRLLVARAPNKTDQFQLIIGLLGVALLENDR